LTSQEGGEEDVRVLRQQLMRRLMLRRRMLLS
jgi:hypothetical protein